MFIATYILLNLIQLSECAPRCEPEPPCSICDGSPTSCTACEAAHYLLGNECIKCTFPCTGCLDSKKCYDCDIENSGYYLSGTSCLPCEYPCLTCYQPTFCYSCGWDVERRTEDRYCMCKGDFYEYVEEKACILCISPCIACSSPDFCFDCDNVNSGLYAKSGKCVPCEYPCQTCASATYCYSCGYDVDKRVNDPTCRCQDGWWDDGSECRPCLLPCTKCTSETFCLYCGSDTTGLYANDEGLCKPCFYPCVNCVGPRDCLSCGWDVELRVQDSTCRCQIGYYECGTKCKPCVEPCKNCTSETNCIDCNNATSGSFYHEENCRPCNYPCQTCYDETTCIVCGYGTDRRNDNGICDCKTGYYEAGYECVECVAPCIVCTSPTTCQDCNHSVSGYYLNDKAQCIRCPYPCTKCTEPSNCLECGWDVENRIETHPQCICKPGLFEWGITCLNCYPPCNQCADSAINCLTCIEGTYLDGDQCMFCLYPCLTCSTQTECITCGWGTERRYKPQITGSYMYLGEQRYYYDDQSCRCLDGYYAHEHDCLPCKLPCVTCTDKHTCLTFDCENSVSTKYYDSTAGACLPCPYPCLTCNNNKTCIECGYDVDRRNSAPSCTCADTYYEDGQECLPCQLPCVTCHSLTSCKTTDYQENVAKQFYNSSTGQVEFCQYPCLTCRNSPTNCLSCGYDAENRNGPAGCACKNGFYEDGQVCRPCVLPCINCSSETQCQTEICDTHDGLITSKYASGHKCYDCQFPCLTCTDSPTKCLTCGYGTERRVPKTDYYHYHYNNSYHHRWSYYTTGSYHHRHVDYSCQCKHGYYDKGQECLPCAYPCRRCNNQQSCQGDTDNEGIYNCNYTVSRLYLSGSTCKPCEYPCNTCYYGAGAGYCHSCGYGASRRVAPYKYSGYNYNWVSGYNRECACKSGYYEDGQECKTCILPCLTCVSQTECLTIFDCDNTRSGLYRSGIECKPCQYPCKFCTSATNCLTCGWDVSNRNGPNSNCTCKSGFYEDASKQLCFQCVLPCLTCTSETDCITIYDCDQATSGYYPDNGVCTPCAYPCVTCSSATNCLTCGYEPELRNPAPTCSCKEGTFSLVNSCEPCSLPCITCTDEVTCLTTYDCDNTESGMYPDNGECKLCQYPCLTCTSATVCLTCKGNLSNRAEAPTCTCLSGFYNRGEECVKCELPCLTCTSATNCLTRDDCDKNSSFTYLSGNTCYQCPYPCILCNNASSCITCHHEITNRDNNASCKCSSGYYEDSNEVCMRCRLPCLTCNGPNKNNCQSYQPCMAGEYRTGHLCVPCPYPCLTCNSATHCTSCGYGGATRDVSTRTNYYYNSYVYDCRCKSGYYHFSALNKCLPCVYPCVTCSNSTSCGTHSDCNYTVTSMFYSSSKCLKCEYPCLTCQTNPTNCYSCGYGGATVRKHPYVSHSYYYTNVYDRSCDCKDGYYEEDNQCKQCVPPCVKCSNSYTCITVDCKNATSKQYWNSDDKQCQDCVYPCLTCSNSGADSCTVCYNSPDKRNSPPNCECKSGYYEKDNDCLKCPLPCATCSSEKVCITYDCSNSQTGLYIYTPPNVGDYEPEDCNLLSEEEQYDVGCKQITPTCEPCQFPCRTCTTATDCLDCGYSPQHREAPSCVCSLSSFVDSDNQACVQNGCNYPCISCDGMGPDSCTQCPDGMFLMGNICNPCKSHCLRCSDLNTCTACTEDYYLDDGFCTPCAYPCITCVSETICLSCGSDFEFRNKPPSCSCLSDFYDNGNTCLMCIKPCDTCFDTNVVSCLSCISGYYLNGSICAFCPEACNSCDSPTVCTTCADGFYLQGVACLPCVYPCATCSDEVHCYSCLEDVDKRLPAPDCRCDNVERDFYDNGLGNCLDCPDPMQSCNPLTNLPYSCIVGYYLYLDGTQVEVFVQGEGDDKQLIPECSCYVDEDEDGVNDGDDCYLSDGTTACNGENAYIYGTIVQYDHTSCEVCPEGNISCNSATEATACEDGYYLEDSECKACISPCTKCMNATWCYECGYGEENRINPPTCECTELLSDHGDKCDTCTSPCVKCTGFGLDQCLSCEDYYYLDVNECKPCHDSCFQCSGPLETDCVLNGQLKCRDGYYPDVDVCKICKYPCATCSNDTYCYTCGYDVENRYDAPYCKCFDELSDHNETCIQCEDPCRQCTGPTNLECVSCQVGYYLVGSTCPQCDSSCTSCSTGPLVCQSCSDGWYLEGEECKACVYPCVTCYQADKCFTCGFTPERRYEPPGCNCKFEYTEHNQDCLECASPCLSCTGITDNECSSCIEGYYLSVTLCLECQTGCKTCDKSNECLNCKDGYYMDDDGVTCQPCSPPCVTCFSATFCYTCGYQPERRVKPPTCSCQVIYTPIGLEICDSCTTPCATCATKSDQDCLSCVDGYYLNGETPTNCLPCTQPCLNCGAQPDICTSCIDGYYYDNNEEGSNCKACQYPCQNCFSATQCVTCGYDPELRTDPPNCDCKNGLADTGNTCGTCTLPCLQCFNTGATDCLSCYEGDYLDGSECKPCQTGCVSCAIEANLCQSCESGYYQDGTNCIQCKYPCATCYSDTECITCGYDTEKRRAPPTCDCLRDQYSDNGTECIVCTHPCQHCTSVSVTDCIDCAHGYYLSDTSCLACPDGCKYCDPTDPTICTDCYDTHYQQADADDGNKLKCYPCISPCATCLSDTHCLTCGYGPELRIHAPTCACKDDYDDAGYGCVTCTEPCLDCNGTTTNDCLSCIDEFVLDPATNTCEPCQLGCATCDLTNRGTCTKCIDEYYLDIDECKPCEYPCITCLTADYCYTCGFDGVDNTQERRNIPPSCSCQDDYSDNGERCVLCTSPCLTCMSEETDKCLTCVIGTFHTEIADGLGTCDTCPSECTHCTSLTSCQQCADTFYLEGENCIPCVYPCETCLTATFCYTCGYDVDRKISPPDCSCKPQYSDSLDEVLGCVVCTSPCKTCMTEADNDCTSCVDDFYLSGTDCLPCHPGCNKCGDSTDSNCTECNDGYYLDGTTCVICKHPCVNCLSDTRCLSCVTGTNRGLAPDCHCNDTFYDNGTDGDCVQCPIPGGVCDNNDPAKYISCADGYYMVNGETSEDLPECVACPSYCATCAKDQFCYECSSSENRGAAPWCQCAVGYYHDGVNCTICPFPSTVCTSATEYQACEDTYFVDGTTCTKCSYPCINCLVDLTCLSCGYDIEDRNPVPQCTCKTGYYDQKDVNGDPINDCVICPSPSIECISETEYLSCIDGYYHNAATNECLDCVYPCEHCVSATFCTKCGYDVINRDDPPTCFCIYGDYYQKNPEDRTCTKCSDDSANCIKCKSYDECLSCKDGYTLEGNDCVPCQPPCITCIGPICLSCGLAEEGSNAPSCDCLNETSDSGTYRTCYDNGDPECAPKPCIAPCENCKSDEECVSCLPGKFRKDPPDCNCIDGFRQDSRYNCVVPCDDGKYAIEDQCYDCEYPCSKCDGEATYCTECSLGYKLAGSGTCAVSCVFPCMDCLDDDPFTCKSRCQGLYRDINKNCACADTYYPDGDLCLPCVHPCENCSSIDTCTKCFDDGEQRNRVEDGGNCECADGYNPYQKSCVKICEPGTFQNYDNCEPCHPQCVTCEGSGSNCLECTYGYYQVELTCERCPINCKNCESDGSGGQVCTECEETAIGRSQDLAEQCMCMEGYFERETIDCGTCITPCVTCETTRITCLTCVENGLNRNPAPDCNCIDNYYAFEDTCLPCSHTCELCKYEATYCTKCYGTGEHRTSILPDCQCEEGYFDDGEDDCKPCEYPCVTCETTKDTCLTCIFELESRHPAPSCECMDGEFEEVDYHCLPCTWKCATCETTNINCLTCVSANRSAPVCDCDDGWFGLDPLPECHKCHKFCRTCELTPENCLECLDDPHREDAPNCACIAGYYHDDQDSICKACQYPCYECSDINTCISCATNPDVQRRDLSFNCKCKTGYYSNLVDLCEKCPDECATCHLVDNNVQCITENPLLTSCDLQCISCVTNKSNCVSCANGFKRNLIPPVCGCDDGYYADFENPSEDCVKCPSQCKTCGKNEQGLVLCTSCHGNKINLPFCQSEKSSFSMAVGNEVIVVECAMQCESCEVADNHCTKCSSGLNRSQQIPECFCNEGYYDNIFGQFDCLPCRKECSSCTKYNYCTACTEGLNRELNPKTAMCECKPQHRPENSGDLKCVPCFMYGKNCYIQCPLNTRLNEKEGICEDYEVNLPSSKIILFTVVGMYAFFKIIMCSGIIGKYRLRMQGMRPLEPKIVFEDKEDDKSSEEQGGAKAKASRIQSYFQQGFTQGDPALNLSSSSEEDKKNEEEFQPKLKTQQHKSFRGQVSLNDRLGESQEPNTKARKSKPKLANLISGLMGKAKQVEAQKLQILSGGLTNIAEQDELNNNNNDNKSMRSTQNKFNLDDVKSVTTVQSDHSNNKLMKSKKHSFGNNDAIEEIVDLEEEQKQQDQQQQQQQQQDDKSEIDSNTNRLDIPLPSNNNLLGPQSRRSQSGKNSPDGTQPNNSLLQSAFQQDTIKESDLGILGGEEDDIKSKSSGNKINNSQDQLSVRQEDNEEI